MKREPNWIDWLAYRFFRWRWNPLFRNNLKLRKAFVILWNFSEEIEAVEKVKMHVPKD